MMITESLAKGLCSRFFNQVDSDKQKSLARLSALRGGKTSRACWHKKMKAINTTVGDLSLASYQGGSKRRPYFAFTGLWVERQWMQSDWHERCLTGSQVFWAYPDQCNELRAVFAVGEHAICRMIERSGCQLLAKDQFSVQSLFDLMRHVPLWSAYWAIVAQSLSEHGVDIKNVELMIPSPAGLFFGRFNTSGQSTPFAVSEIRTFVGCNQLSDTQEFIRRKQLAAGLPFVYSPLSMFPTTLAFCLDNPTLLKWAIDFELEPWVDLIANQMSQLMDSDEERRRFKAIFTRVNTEVARDFDFESVQALRTGQLRETLERVKQAQIVRQAA